MTDNSTVNTSALDERPERWGPGLRRVFASGRVRIGLLLLGIIALVVLIGPLLYTVDPNAVDTSAIQRPPGDGHPLGTDSVGRDVLARLLAGGRISLAVGVAAAAFAVALGVILGAVAGFFGGWADSILSRITDVFLSFPALIVLVMLVAFVGGNALVLIGAIALFGWPVVFRVCRGSVLTARELLYVQAARGVAAGPVRILRRHVLPAVAGPVLVAGTLLVATSILSEAALSYLGLGVPQPTASWGNMLNDAQSFTVLAYKPWMWIAPGLALSATVLAVNLLGDGLRDATDTKR